MTNASAKTLATNMSLLHTVSVKRSKVTPKSAQTVIVTKTVQSAAQLEYVPVCPGGQEQIAHYDEDGCCATYVCECVCEGYSGYGYTTFDAYNYTHKDVCVTHTLARDFGGDFIVSMHRGADHQLNTSRSMFAPTVWST